ncbi:MAG: DUF1232 domain-containing protein [Paludibacteraceae bacterium]|nr:DUF1232 domain-containing protein [Paludibacteraceae bacterium]HOU68836.1 DUF1232 domain-containing protein [Paludibacteraceae bacterium]HQF50734.1 DUF1232 domain-containing protein [Paludibacteraceae bacterium]
MEEEKEEQNLWEKLESYSKDYSPQELFSKLTNVAKKAGIKIVFYVLLLYYSLVYGNLSLKEKSIIIAALGYFISPVDLIPDLFPMGYSDDLALIIFIVTKLKGSFTPEIRTMAIERLKKYFDNVNEESLNF